MSDRYYFERRNVRNPKGVAAMLRLLKKHGVEAYDDGEGGFVVQNVPASRREEVGAAISALTGKRTAWRKYSW